MVYLLKDSKQWYCCSIAAAAVIMVSSPQYYCPMVKPPQYYCPFLPSDNNTAELFTVTTTNTMVATVLPSSPLLCHSPVMCNLFL